MGINELLPTLSKSQKDPYQQQKSIHNKTSLALICDAVSDASSSSKRGQQSCENIDYEEQHALWKLIQQRATYIYACFKEEIVLAFVPTIFISRFSISVALQFQYWL